MNKPAATILFDKNFYHMIWPADLDDKKVVKYKEAGVHVVSRGLGPVSTKDKNS